MTHGSDREEEGLLFVPQLVTVILFMNQVLHCQTIWKSMIMPDSLCLTEKGRQGNMHSHFLKFYLVLILQGIKAFQMVEVREQKITVVVLHSIPFTASVKDLPFQAFALYLDVANAFQWRFWKEKKYHSISFFVENEEVMRKEEWKEVRKGEEKR